jgi:hypothetical protein
MGFEMQNVSNPSQDRAMRRSIAVYGVGRSLLDVRIWRVYDVRI